MATSSSDPYGNFSFEQARQFEAGPPNRKPWAGILAGLVAVLLIIGVRPRAGAATPVEEWWSMAITQFQAMGPPLGALGRATQAHDLPGARAACQQLHDANAALQGSMPTPEPDLTAEVQAMIDDIDAGSRTCMSGTETSDINKTVSYLQQAAAHYNAAKGILAKYGVQA